MNCWRKLRAGVKICELGEKLKNVDGNSVEKVLNLRNEAQRRARPRTGGQGDILSRARNPTRGLGPEDPKKTEKKKRTEEKEERKRSLPRARFSSLRP